MSDVSSDLKECLRKYPAAVNVISLRQADGSFTCITATAVTVATLQPPIMLVCVGRESAFGRAVQDVDYFAINVLAQGQVDVANAGAGSVAQEDREKIGVWEDGAERTPILLGAQANMVCRKHEVIPVGTHLMVLGEVVTANSTELVAPLLYLNRGYGAFVPE